MERLLETSLSTKQAMRTEIARIGLSELILET